MGRRNWSVVVASLLVAAVLLALVVWQFVSVSMRPIEIAIIVPFSGRLGPEINNSIELALSESPLQDRITLIRYDTWDEGSDNAAQRNIDHTETVINRPSVVAVIGGTSSRHVQTTLPLLNEASMVLISSFATSPRLTKPGFFVGEPGMYYPTGERNFFRTVYTDEQQGAIAAQWMAQQAVSNVIVIAGRDASYSQGLADLFLTNAEIYGLNIQAELWLEPSERPTADDIGGIVAAVNNMNPDAVYFPMVSASGQDAIVVAILQELPDLMIMGADGMTFDNFEAAEEDFTILNGLFATALSVDPIDLESAAGFVDAYQQAYDALPPGYAMTTYDAMLALLQAIENTPSPVTRAGVLASMQSLGNVDGALGRWSFDQNGDINLLAISIVQFDNGEWSTVDTIR
jgi:branched-chain amino acid transport system substrate-binding protein